MSEKPVDESKLTYDVRIITPAIVTSEAVLRYKGKGTLEVSEEGFTLARKALIGHGPMIALRWDQLRELRDELATRRRFRANFGATEGDVVLTIKIVGGDIGILQSHLMQLPQSVRDLRCPACGGAVRSEVCTQCGRNPRAVNRRKGLVKIGAGAAAGVTGLIGTIVLYSLSILGEIILVFVALVLMGAVLVLIGLVQLLFGVRA